MDKQISVNPSDYVTNIGLKKKFKKYLTENCNCDDIKPNIYPKLLVTSLLVLLEQFVGECVKYVKKNEQNGLYVITTQNVKNIINDYENENYLYLRKYFQKYNKVIKYSDLMLFNIKKAFDALEEKYGAKLMIDHDAFNFICYLFASFQYDMIDLSVKFVRYGKKCFMVKQCFLYALEYLIDAQTFMQLSLKLDSLDVTTKDEEVDEEDKEAEEVVENEENEEYVESDA